MKSEAELAGVLAHEIAHVLKKTSFAVNQKSARTGPFDRCETQPGLAPRFMEVLNNAEGGAGQKAQRK